MTKQLHSEKDSPKIYRAKIEYYKDIWFRMKENKSSMIGGSIIVLFILIAVFGPFFLMTDPNLGVITEKLQAPSKANWFGTDQFGRDVFARIVYGMNLTLRIGFISVIAGGIIGVILGLIAGYYGGIVDTVIMRVMDVLLAFPGILLALAIVSVLGGSLTNVIIAVSIFSIPTFARVVRGATLTIGNLEYIDAIRALGATDFRIIFMHILPNTISLIIVQATLRIARAILTASSLSFLGLGAQPPTPEWGAMLSDGRPYISDAPHVIFFPGIMIVIVVLAFNLFGDGLRDALDPKMNK